MFTIALSRNPDAAEVQRVMSVVGLIAGMEVMQHVTASLMASAAPQPILAGPQASDVFAPPAPVPPAPAPLQQADAAPRDSAGFPWTDSIHSSAKSFNKDGTWKKKRGVQDATVTQVEAQLRLSYPAPGAVPPAPVGAFTAPAPVPPAPIPVPPAPMSVPPAPVPPAPVGAAGPMDFIGLMGVITGYINAGKITQQDVATVCQQFGVASAPLLAQRPDLIPSVAAQLAAVALTR